MDKEMEMEEEDGGAAEEAAERLMLSVQKGFATAKACSFSARGTSTRALSRMTCTMAPER